MDINRLTRSLMDTDWDMVLDNDVDTAAENLTRVILNAAKETIPTKTVRIKTRDKPWMTKPLKRHIHKRNTLFKTAKRLQTTESWDKWKQQRNFVTHLNRQLRNQHIHSETGKLLLYKHDPFNYHKTLKSLTGQHKRQDIPPLETNEGETITDDSQKANILNNYFAQQTELRDVPTLPETQAPIDKGSVPALSQIQATEQEVLKMLNSLDT